MAVKLLLTSIAKTPVFSLLIVAYVGLIKKLVTLKLTLYHFRIIGSLGLPSFEQLGKFNFKIFEEYTLG